ncbi:hypothetical protein OG259_24110 [Streptomyces sp. NBC_00250]|uniref:hypothetical protein n=1 Tax=unclassified Streptomyces TaxID=2593676 RepID=UPI002251F52B|nr:MULTISPECIES: hypothetical protein [unclassified Streptomyces]MCX4981526.1 hypothetical protein [Streptomyces sp. NBC_00572]
MGDIDATNPVVTPENLHITGTETDKIGTKNLHITSEPADAIADKVLGDGPAENLHITSEPAN